MQDQCGSSADDWLAGLFPEDVAGAKAKLVAMYEKEQKEKAEQAKLLSGLSIEL